LINEVWNKIVSETEEYSDMDETKFIFKKEENKLVLAVTQSKNSIFDFEKFLLANKTLSIYKKIKNYGNIFITSQRKELNILTEEIIDTKENRTTIRVELKYESPVRNGSKKRVKKNDKQNKNSNYP